MLEKTQTFPQPSQNKTRSSAQPYDVILPDQNKGPAHTYACMYLLACNLLKTEHRKEIITSVRSNQIVEETNTTIIKRKTEKRISIIIHIFHK